MKDSKSMKEWLGAVTLGIVIAASAAATLFLAGPMLLGSDKDYALHEDVSASGWSPFEGIDFLNVDSVGKLGNSPALCIRYGADAPGRLDLSLTSVLPDGSERRDTIGIDLRDRFGAPVGIHGYGVAERVCPFVWTMDVADCRLMEVAPLEKVKGIFSVGLLIRNDFNNENHRPSVMKESAI